LTKVKDSYDSGQVVSCFLLMRYRSQGVLSGVIPLLHFFLNSGTPSADFEYTLKTIFKPPKRGFGVPRRRPLCPKRSSSEGTKTDWLAQ